ncbi:hypothetical protein E2562_018503 [Oryza meyeriana var. granulata]|uniref:Uncharacterized protein n=1 Tax=Oryza meyeriana var. granulata TaxID=110450 RepID=A0A6G1EML7_9ORYZ|nr:hypothetical protein E2562_018503 [Oryza meyeriana var. granulata]
MLLSHTCELGHGEEGGGRKKGMSGGTIPKPTRVRGAPVPRCGDGRAEGPTTVELDTMQRSMGGKENTTPLLEKVAARGGAHDDHDAIVGKPEVTMVI